MHENEQQIESVLRRYRPVSPPPDLRARVLREMSEPPARLLTVWRIAAAVALAASAGLMIESARLGEQAIQMAAREPAPSPAIETATALLGGDEAAERYVAITLALDRQRLRAAAGAGASSTLGGFYP